MLAPPSPYTRHWHPSPAPVTTRGTPRRPNPTPRRTAEPTTRGKHHRQTAGVARPLTTVANTQHRLEERPHHVHPAKTPVPLGLPLHRRHHARRHPRRTGSAGDTPLARLRHLRLNRHAPVHSVSRNMGRPEQRDPHRKAASPPPNHGQSIRRPSDADAPPTQARTGGTDHRLNATANMQARTQPASGKKPTPKETDHHAMANHRFPPHR